MFHWPLALGPASTGDATTQAPARIMPSHCCTTAERHPNPDECAGVCSQTMPQLSHRFDPSSTKNNNPVTFVFPSRPAWYSYHIDTYHTTPIAPPIPSSDHRPTLNSIQRSLHSNYLSRRGLALATATDSREGMHLAPRLLAPTHPTL